MNEDTLTPEEQALLAAWLKTAPAAALSAEQLADWLAGRLEEAAAAPVEHALAEDPQLRAALLALWEGATEIAPADEVARARVLVPGVSRGSSRNWRYAVAACLLLAAGSLGWVVGFGAADSAADHAAVSAADTFGDGAGL